MFTKTKTHRLTAMHKNYSCTALSLHFLTALLQACQVMSEQMHGTNNRGHQLDVVDPQLQPLLDICLALHCGVTVIAKFLTN